jgi:sulfofructose kinase
VIFSRPGLAQLTGQADIAGGLRAAERLGTVNAVTAVTDGEHGVFWWADGVLRRQRPPVVTAVDTTGAGDAFHGAYALALARGTSPDTCLRFATAVAAAKCVQPGGRAGLPDTAALTAFVRRHPLPDIE